MRTSAQAPKRASAKSTSTKSMCSAQRANYSKCKTNCQVKNLHVLGADAKNALDSHPPFRYKGWVRRERNSEKSNFSTEKILLDNPTQIV